MTSYDYDLVGNVISTTDAKGQKTQLAFDTLNRLISISYADGKSVAYSYDADGKRTSMADSHGTTGYAYDSLDRLTSVTHPGGKIVKYAYDAVGNRTSLTYPDGKLLSYSFDPANRLVGVTDWTGESTTCTYDAAGNLLETQYPNQVNVAFSYDASNRLLAVTNGHKGSPGNPISRFIYFHDPVGNRLVVTNESNEVTSYSYDPLYELLSFNYNGKITSYTYDPVGNRLTLTKPSGGTTSYTYDADDRMLSSNHTTYTYDANGNLTSQTHPASGQTINYTYDAANRLVNVAGGSSTSDFEYDGDGNRVTQSIVAGTYNYVNDGASALPVVLQESGPDGDISYSYGLGRISESSTSFDYFYQYDGLGSVVGLTEAKGKIAQRYGYDAWGDSTQTVPKNAIATENKFRFTSEALDPASGLYYLRARYYDPELGRFISRDPFAGFASLPISNNRYIYARNNPTNLVDPSGDAPEGGPETVPSCGALPTGPSLRIIPPPTPLIINSSRGGLPKLVAGAHMYRAALPSRINSSSLNVRRRRRSRSGSKGSNATAIN